MASAAVMTGLGYIESAYASKKIERSCVSEGVSTGIRFLCLNLSEWSVASMVTRDGLGERIRDYCEQFEGYQSEYDASCRGLVRVMHEWRLSGYSDDTRMTMLLEVHRMKSCLELIADSCADLIAWHEDMLAEVSELAESRFANVASAAVKQAYSLQSKCENALSGLEENYGQVELMVGPRLN